MSKCYHSKETENDEKINELKETEIDKNIDLPKETESVNEHEEF
jgi:hypothetical protein